MGGKRKREEIKRTTAGWCSSTDPKSKKRRARKSMLHLCFTLTTTWIVVKCSVPVQNDIQIFFFPYNRANIYIHWPNVRPSFGVKAPEFAFLVFLSSTWSFSIAMFSFFFFSLIFFLFSQFSMHVGPVEQPLT